MKRQIIVLLTFGLMVFFAQSLTAQQGGHGKGKERSEQARSKAHEMKEKGLEHVDQPLDEVKVEVENKGEKMKDHGKKVMERAERKMNKEHKEDRGNEDVEVEPVREDKGESHGHAYGKDKGDLSGKEFGQERAKQARMNKEEKLKDLNSSIGDAEAKVQHAQRKIDAYEEELVREKDNMKPEEYEVAMEKLAKAKAGVEELKSRIRTGKEQISQEEVQ